MLKQTDPPGLILILQVNVTVGLGAEGGWGTPLRAVGGSDVSVLD